MHIGCVEVSLAVKQLGCRLKSHIHIQAEMTQFNLVALFAIVSMVQTIGSTVAYGLKWR